VDLARHDIALRYRRPNSSDAFVFTGIWIAVLLGWSVTYFAVYLHDRRKRRLTEDAAKAQVIVQSDLGTIQRQCEATLRRVRMPTIRLNMGRGWVDQIRDKGNDAAHELPQMTVEDAKELIEFTEMLLRFIYDLPARAPKGP